MGLQLATAVIKVRADGSRVKSDLRGVKRGVTSSMRGMAASIKSTMGPMLAMVGVGGGILALQQFAMAGETFNRKMRGSLAIMGDVSDAMKGEMRQAAFDVAKTTKFSADQAAESYFFLASAGLDAKQSIAGLPQVALFAQAGMFDMARATDLVTDAQSALGMTVKDSQQNLKNMTLITDTLVKANTLANASVEQFSEALTSDAATASRMLGMELKTTMAILALYADKGKKAGEAGNLFGRATRLLTKASRDNADEFKSRNIKVINEATGGYRNLIDIIEDMNQAFKGMTKPEIGKALSDLGFEALAQKSILPLLNSTVVLKGYETALDDVAETTKKIADKQLTPFQKVMALLGATFTQVSASISKNLEPAFAGLLVVMKGGISTAEKISSIFPNLIQSVTRMSIAILALTTALVAARIAIRLLGISARTALIGTGIGVALVAIGVAVNLLVDKFDLFGKVGPIFDDMKKRFSGWGIYIRTTGDLIKVVLIGVFEKIKKNWAVLVWGLTFGWNEWIKTIKEVAGPSFKAIASAFITVSDSVLGELDIMFGSFEGFFGTLKKWAIKIALVFQTAWLTATNNVAKGLLYVMNLKNKQDLKWQQDAIDRKEATLKKSRRKGDDNWGRMGDPNTPEGKKNRASLIRELENLKTTRAKLKGDSDQKFLELENDFQRKMKAIGENWNEADDKWTNRKFPKFSDRLNDLKKQISDLFSDLLGTRQQKELEEKVGESIRSGIKGAWELVSSYIKGAAVDRSAKDKGEQTKKGVGKDGKFERVGFTEFGNKIQDALLQRDDPTKDAKETAKNTKETNHLIKNMTTDVVKGLNKVAAKVGGFLT